MFRKLKNKNEKEFKEYYEIEPEIIYLRQKSYLMNLKKNKRGLEKTRLRSCLK